MLVKHSFSSGGCALAWKVVSSRSRRYPTRCADRGVGLVTLPGWVGVRKPNKGRQRSIK
jgi:hypothetical protein